MKNELTNLSSALSSLVAAAGKSVVSVDARRRSAASGVVWADGIVITTSHAIEREDGIRVGLPSGEVVDAKLRGRDPSTDLAVLEVPTRGAPPLAWSDGELVLGQLVLSVARPANTPAATLGIVSALDADWRTHGGGKIDRWLEVDLDLPTGFSGSVLVDTHGRALGIASTGLVRGRRLVIPASTVRRVVDALLSRGQVQRGFLGVGSHPIRLPPSLEEKTGQSSALILVSVQPGGPAEQAGLLIGDVLLSLDGRPTTDVGELVSLLDDDKIGKEVTLRLVRAGQLTEAKVKVGARSWS